MTTHSSIPAWRILMDRGAWWVTVHGVAELDMTEWLTLSPSLSMRDKDCFLTSFFLFYSSSAWRSTLHIEDAQSMFTNWGHDSTHLIRFRLIHQTIKGWPPSSPHGPQWTSECTLIILTHPSSLWLWSPLQPAQILAPLRSHPCNLQASWFSPC